MKRMKHSNVVLAQQCRPMTAIFDQPAATASANSDVSFCVCCEMDHSIVHSGSCKTGSYSLESFVPKTGWLWHSKQ